MKSCLHNLWIPRNKVKREHYINVKQERWFIGTANILQLIFYFRTPSMAARDSRNCKPRFTTETPIFSFLLLPLFLSTHFPWAVSLHTTEGNKCYYILPFLPSALSARGPISCTFTESFLRRLKFWHSTEMWYLCSIFMSRGQLKCDGTRAETRFRLSAKRTGPFKSAGLLVQSTTGSWGMRISGSNAGYTTFRGSVKGTGYSLHSPVSPSLPLPCVAVCHHFSTGIYFAVLVTCLLVMT